MSYTRDRDRATRGVGAIASADHSPARQARRAHVAQATRARDRAMARIARGSLGAVVVSPGDGTTATNPVLSFLPGGTYTGVSIAADIFPKSPSPPPPPRPTDPGALPPPRVSPPSSVPPAPPPTPSGGAMSAPAPSGGGSVGVAMGPAPASAPIPIIPTLDTGAQDQTMPGISDNTMRNVLIAGGAALAAYLLFRRRP